MLINGSIFFPYFFLFEANKLIDDASTLPVLKQQLVGLVAFLDHWLYINDGHGHGDVIHWLQSSHIEAQVLAAKSLWCF